MRNLYLWLVGKSYLYLLNAATDAQLAETLVAYCQEEKIDSDRFPRAAELIKKAGNDKKLILGIAYCQYYFNGWYDFVWGKLFAKLVNNDFPLKNNYPEVSSDIFSLTCHLVWPMASLLLGQMPNLDRFFLKFNLDEKALPKATLVKACCLTQKENIKSNLAEIKALKTNGSSKAKKINNFVNQFDRKEVFLKTVKKTLGAASFWDGLFYFFLKLRFAFLVKLSDE